MSVLARGLDGQHRAGGVEQNPLRVRPEDQLADGGAPTKADDDELGVLLLGDGDEVFGRLVSANQLTNLVLKPEIGQLLLDGFELCLELRGLISVEVLATPLGVDDDQAGMTQFALLGRATEGSSPLFGRNVSDNDGHRNLLVDAGRVLSATLPDSG